MTEKYDASDVLHRALLRTLPAPSLAAEFRAALQRKILQESVERLEARRQELEQEHASALARLQRNHVRMQRDTLAIIIGVAFTAGACAHLALPWLHGLLGGESAIALPLIVVAAGLAAGAGVLQTRFR